MSPANEIWPALPLESWKDTYETLHLWTQVAGKVRLKLTPKLNHWWNVTLYVNARGLTTAAMPYGSGSFEIQFDFVEHRLEIKTCEGRGAAFALEPMTVARFYAKLMAALESLGIHVEIYTKPQELANPIPFEQDEVHGSYDAEFAHRHWRILLSTCAVLEEFRARFIGKCSPAHFFWGSFDLACTRYSGRRAPPRKGIITAEAYSHECISAGFWPGMGLGAPAFYSYTAPVPAGLRDDPAAARYWNEALSEFVLPYDDVRGAASPRATLLEFLETTYEAGARCAGWNRSELERA